MQPYAATDAATPNLPCGTVVWIMAVWDKCLQPLAPACISVYAMSSDTELDELRPVHSASKAVDSLSECADGVTASSVALRELEIDFQELEVEEPEARHLPDGVVRKISSYLVTGVPSTSKDGDALLSLLAMCGVSRHWRSAAQELEADVGLSYSGYESVFSSIPMVQRFKKLSPAAKEEVFASAAKLFSGALW